MVYTLRRFDDPGAFHARAAPWLLRAEAENNLLLGLSERLTRSTHGFDPPLYLATVEDADGRLVGCGFRTPPYKVGLTAMPADAARLLADDVAQVYAEVPAVLGPAAPARAFAETWAARRGLAPRPGMAQRIYRLERLVWPTQGPPPGHTRSAAPADVELLAAWLEAFSVEAGVGAGRDALTRAREATRAGAITLWVDDGRPVSMAGVAAATPNGARVGYVYTPPGRRGRGYATWCVARLSARLLAGGKRFCFLYTDMANPTSNAIYQRLGYAPVCDVAEWTWSDAGRS